MLEVLPEKLHNNTQVSLLLSSGMSAVFHKKLSTDYLDKEMYISVTALLYVVAGEQIIANLDGDRRVIRAGQLLLLTKDLYLVSDFVAQSGIFEALIFFVEQDRLSGYFSDQPPICQQLDSSKSRPTPSISRSDENPSLDIATCKEPLGSPERIGVLSVSARIRDYMNALLSVYAGHLDGDRAKNTVSSDARVFDSKIVELMALISHQPEAESFLDLLQRSTLMGKRRDIAAVMEASYSKNLSLADYAQLTGRSVSTFIREFKRRYGTTPNQWLIRKRLEKAQHLLENTHASVTEIAFDVGYENVSHFIAAYKKAFGCTPSRAKSLL